MPKAENDRQTATEAVAAEKSGSNGGAKNIAEHKAQARESREDALTRAFGEVFGDDLDEDILGPGGPDTEESPTEPEASAPAKPQVDPAVVAALQDKITALEEKLAAEHTRQEEAEDVPIEAVAVPSDWDGIQPTLQAERERNEKRDRAIEKQIQDLTQKQFEIRAETDLNRFASRHPDFWELSDEIADTAKREKLDIFDYQSLQVGYDLVKGRRAIAKLSETQRKQSVADEMKQQAGSVPRFRAPQRQTRDEDVAPGNRLLTFDQAWEKGLSKLRAGRKR